MRQVLSSMLKAKYAPACETDLHLKPTDYRTGMLALVRHKAKCHSRLYKSSEEKDIMDEVCQLTTCNVSNWDVSSACADLMPGPAMTYSGA